MRKTILLALLLGVTLLMTFPVQGETASAQRTIRPADPIVYGLGSFVLPGLGQFMLGDRGTALTHFVVAIAIPTACYYLGYISPFLPVYPACGLASLAWHAYSGVDAYDLAAGVR